MDHFNDLPKRDKNHAIESKAEAAFHRCLSSSDNLVLQKVDRKDYGSDCEIEVIDRGRATNIRIHAQLKGTEKDLNTDGSVSVEISRSNLNYLLMHPYSFYVCYHLPSDTLWIRTTESVLRQYEHSDKNWSGQQTLTVTFCDPLTEERLKTLVALARSSAFSLRDRRIAHSSARAEDVPVIVKRALPDLHVGEDEKQAADVLSSLYASGADEVISAAFDRFESVLGPDHDAMGFCYMAEINLGMAGRSHDLKRIADGISHLASKLETGRYQVGSLHYSIGNGFAALGREEEAVAEYEKALDQLSISDGAELLAQCHKT